MKKSQRNAHARKILLESIKWSYRVYKKGALDGKSALGHILAAYKIIKRAKKNKSK